MAERIINVQHFTHLNKADIFLHTDFFIYEDRIQALNSRKYWYKDFRLWKVESEKPFYFFFKDEEFEDSVILAIFQESDSFLKAIKTKGVSVSNTLNLVGIRDGKLFVDEGQTLRGYEYQGLYFVSFYQGKKVVKKRFVYVLGTDLINDIKNTIEDQGTSTLNLDQFNTKLSAKKRSG